MRDKTGSAVKLMVLGFALLAAALNIDIVLAVLGKIARVTRPLAIGLLLAIALDSPTSFLERKICKKRGLAVALTVLALVGSLALLLAIAIPQLSSGFARIAEKLPYYIVKIGEFFERVAAATGLSEDALAALLPDTANLSERLMQTASSFATTLFDAAGRIVNFVVAIVFAVYVLLKKEPLVQLANRFAKTFTRGGVYDKLYKYSTFFAQSFKRFANGQVIEALILGTLCFIGMSVIRLPYSGFVSVLVGFTSLVPVIGAYLGAVPAILLLLLENPVQALAFTIFIVALQQFEGSVIYPKVVGEAVGIDGLFVFAGVTLGAGFGGLLGVLVAVPATAVLGGALGFALHERESKQEKRKEK